MFSGGKVLQEKKEKEQEKKEKEQEQEQEQQEPASHCSRGVRSGSDTQTGEQKGE